MNMAENNDQWRRFGGCEKGNNKLNSLFCIFLVRNTLAGTENKSTGKSFNRIGFCLKTKGSFYTFKKAFF